MDEWRAFVERRIRVGWRDGALITIGSVGILHAVAVAYASSVWLMVITVGMLVFWCFALLTYFGSKRSMREELDKIVAEYEQLPTWERLVFDEFMAERARALLPGPKFGPRK